MSKNMFKTKILRKVGFVSIALMIFCVSCAPQQATQVATEPPSVEVTTAEPVVEEATAITCGTGAAENQSIRIIIQYYDDDWSPMRGGGPKAFWISLWWASPMYFDSSGELHPYVFSEWQSNEEYTVWTFKIDPKAVFSDGSPITAEDVKGTWDLNAQPETRNQRVGLFFSGVEGYKEVSSGTELTMSGIVALDASTVEVHLTDADPVFYKRIASALISPLKISQVRGEDGKEKLQWWLPENGVIVSGPFKPVSINIDEGTAVFEPNPNFWLAKPKLQKIELITVTDPETQITMFKNAEVDGTTELFTPNLVEELGESFIAGPMTPRGHQFWFDASKEPLNDINVRKALILSVDPDQVFEVAFPDGPGAAVHQLINAVPGEDQGSMYYQYDPEAAKAALAASSYGSAENLPKLYFVGISQSSHELAAQYIAEQWRQVLGIEQVEMKASYDEYTGTDQSRIQIFRDDIGSRFPDAVAYLMGSIHSSSGPAQSKMGGYKNEDIDSLLEEASTIPDTDPKRVDLALQAQNLYFEDWMFIPYYHQNMPVYALPWLLNWDKNLDWQVIEPWNACVEAH